MASTVPSFDLTNSNESKRNAALKELDTYLSTRSYMEGWTKSSVDAETFLNIPGRLDAKKYANVSRWASHIGFFSEEQRASWRVVAKPEPEPESDEESDDPFNTNAAADESDEESDDPFNTNAGDDSDSDEGELVRANAEKVAQITARQNAKKGKAKSNITLDVKPEGLEVDMDQLKEDVMAVEMEGLRWLGGDFINIAFGLRKLRIMCQVFDEIVQSADDVIEAVEQVEGVMSCDMFAMQMA
jgi:elongation factor 1-beta